LEYGAELLEKFKEQLEDMASVERQPNMEGRSMIAIFAPDKKKIAAFGKARLNS